MSTETNKATVRRLIEDVVNTGNVERLAEFVSSDFRESADTTGQATGVDAMRAAIQLVGDDRSDEEGRGGDDRHRR